MSSVAPSRKKAVKVKLKDIMVDTYVREKTDPEYVFHLAILYEAGVEVTPIEEQGVPAEERDLEFHGKNHSHTGRDKVIHPFLGGLHTGSTGPPPWTSNSSIAAKALVSATRWVLLTAMVAVSTLDRPPLSKAS